MLRAVVVLSLSCLVCGFLSVRPASNSVLTELPILGEPVCNLQPGNCDAELGGTSFDCHIFGLDKNGKIVHSDDFCLILNSTGTYISDLTTGENTIAPYHLKAYRNGTSIQYLTRQGHALPFISSYGKIQIIGAPLTDPNPGVCATAGSGLNASAAAFCNMLNAYDITSDNETYLLGSYLVGGGFTYLNNFAETNDWVKYDTLTEVAPCLKACAPDLKYTNTYFMLPPDVRVSRSLIPLVSIEPGTSVAINEDDYDANLVSLVYLAPLSSYCTLSLFVDGALANYWSFVTDATGKETFTFDDATPGVTESLLTLCCTGVCASVSTRYDRSEHGCIPSMDDVKGFNCYYKKYPKLSWPLTVLMGLVFIAILYLLHRKGYLIPMLKFLSIPFKWLLRVIQAPFRWWIEKKFNRKRPEGGHYRRLAFFAYLLSSYPWASSAFGGLGTNSSALNTTVSLLPISALNVSYKGCDAIQVATIAANLQNFDTHGFTPVQLADGSVPHCTVSGDDVTNCVFQRTMTTSVDLVQGAVYAFTVVNLSVPGSQLPDGEPADFTVNPISYGVISLDFVEAFSTTYEYTGAIDFTQDLQSYDYCDGDSPQEHSINFNWCQNPQCNYQTFDCTYHASWYRDGQFCWEFPNSGFKYANGAPVQDQYFSRYTLWPDADYFITGEVADACSTCNTIMYYVKNYTTDNFYHVYSVQAKSNFQHSFATFRRNTTNIDFTCARQDASLPISVAVDTAMTVTISNIDLPQASSLALANQKIFISEGLIGTGIRHNGNITAVVGPGPDRGYGVHTGPGFLQYFGQPVSGTLALPRVSSLSPCSGNLFSSSCWEQMWDPRSFAANPYRDLSAFLSDYGHAHIGALIPQTSEFDVVVENCDMGTTAPVVSSHNVSYYAFNISISRPAGAQALMTFSGSVPLAISEVDVHPRFIGKPLVTGTVGDNLYSNVCVNVTSITSGGATTISIDPPMDGGTSACFIPSGSIVTCCITVHLGEEQGVLRVIAAAGGGYQIPSLYANFSVGIDSSTPTFTTFSKALNYDESTGGSDGSISDEEGGWFSGLGSLGSSLLGMAGGSIIYSLLMILLYMILPILFIYLVFRLVMNLLSRRSGSSPSLPEYVPIPIAPQPDYKLAYGQAIRRRM